MLRHLPLAIAGVACIVLVWLLAVVLPQMPEPLATQFGFDGSARHFTSRATFTWITTATMAALLAGFACVHLVHKLPNRLINMPAKDYWLAPERRTTSLDYLRNWVQWILAASMVLVAAADWFSIQANQVSPPRLPSAFFWLMAAYIAIFVLAMVQLTRRFRRPRS